MPLWYNSFFSAVSLMLVLSLLVAVTATPAVGEPKERLNVTAFGAHSGDRSDTVPAVRAALEQCRKTGANVLVFPKGRYDFYPDRASEQYVFISNNDEGLRRVAFPLSGCTGLEIDGQGSEFIFHGVIIPFVLAGAKQVTVRNLSIDWEQTFHTEGTVVSVDDNAVELTIPEQFPYKVVNERFQHMGAGKEDFVLGNMLEFDTQRRETAFGAQDNYGAADRLQVVVRPGSGRIVSATADATHFVSCRGRIKMTDCRFENQKDDATNVHGIYTRITGRPDAYSVEVRLMHGQQFGIHPAKVGHTMQFVKGDTLLPAYQAKVTKVRAINKEFTILTFAKPLPATLTPNDAVLDLYWQPTDVLIKGCTLGSNRARGFLISVQSHVVIEECTFHTPGAAILITGDANYWFESGPVRDVTVRNNRFIDCNYGVWGSAAIEINPEIKPEHRQEPRYHRNIRIENNRFEVFFPRLLRAHSVDGLRFTGNTVVPSNRYPAKEPTTPPLDIRDCSHVIIENK